MFRSKWTAVILLAASAFAGSAITAVGALGDQGHGRRGHRQDTTRIVLHTSLAPSIPSDPTLLGSAPGGLPWALRSGEASLRSNGRMQASIRGLVIPVAPFTGTAGPVTTVTASLYCGGNSTPVGTSAPVPISTHGNAYISAKFTLPAKCLIPALLIHPNGAASVYIASSGFSG